MAANYGYMNIWHTTPPTNQDFPIWAYVGNNPDDVVLMRSKLDILKGEHITWCKASIPQPPKNHIRERYEVLSENSIDRAWSSYEWFKAGYEYGIERSESTDCCDKSQAKKSAKSPFVNPEEYWDDPNESAFDERL
jgi:hypothetical protein